MSSNYYYIYSSLPEIYFDEKQDYRQYSYLFDEVMESLSDPDKLAVRYVRYPIDNANLIYLLDGKESKFLEGGNYSLRELKNEIHFMDSIPSYMVEYLELNNKSQSPHFGPIPVDHLNESFYNEIMNLHHGRQGMQFLKIGAMSQSGELIENPVIFNSDFIKRWYVFERDLNNVLTAIECLKHNEPIEKRETLRISQRMGQRLSGDYDITQSLIHSKSYDYSLSGQLPWMNKVLNFDSSNIHKYEKDIILLKLERLEELSEGEIFSLNSILAYFIKLRILVRWSSLDETVGNEFIKNLSRNMMNAELTEKFKFNTN